MEGNTRSCKKCHRKEINPQNWKATFEADGLTLTSNDRDCLDKSKANNRAQRGQGDGKENDHGDSASGNDAFEFIGVTALPLDTFLDPLSTAGDITLFSTMVDISSFHPDDAKETVDALAELVWEKIGYRFQYASPVDRPEIYLTDF
ncbi:hypothetical protein B0H14DRAFT_2608043 [Mycena olivaceomarginata]|nr:hypothetical protein B0H14DRAFT_2608043 [Mycena olivaceomarginata]